MALDLTKSHPKHSINRAYFENVDTPEKAYILGFLYADGCNFTEGFSVTLASSDLEMLEFIKFELGATQPIYTYATNKGTLAKGLSVSSVKMAQDLSRLGCHPRKTQNLQFPSAEQVPERLISHFVRGFFDGDGSVYTVKVKSTHTPNIFIEFVGVQSFLEVLESTLREGCDLKFKKTTNCTNTDKVRRLSYGGRKAIRKIYEFMYPDNTFSLARKKERFTNYYNG